MQSGVHGSSPVWQTARGTHADIMATELHSCLWQHCQCMFSMMQSLSCVFNVTAAMDAVYSLLGYAAGIAHSSGLPCCMPVHGEAQGHLQNRAKSENSACITGEVDAKDEGCGQVLPLGSSVGCSSIRHATDGWGHAACPMCLAVCSAGFSPSRGSACWSSLTGKQLDACRVDLRS